MCCIVVRSSRLRLGDCKQLALVLLSMQAAAWKLERLSLRGHARSLIVTGEIQPLVTLAAERDGKRLGSRNTALEPHASRVGWSYNLGKLPALARRATPCESHH